MCKRLVAILCCIACAAACSRDKPEATPAATSEKASVVPAKPDTGADVNIAAADMGGAVEELTGNYGPGFTGRRLIDGLVDPTWKIGEEGKAIHFPQEAVISFYERRPALIEAIVFVLPADPAAAPKQIEVWTSQSADSDKGYAKATGATLEAKPGEQRVNFDPVEARYVKLRILSGAKNDALEIADVRLIEAVREGYQPLFEREPLATRWKGSPREAAQRGLDWIQQAAPVWAKTNNCFGCHIQAQALMGQAVAVEQNYRVNMGSVRALDTSMRETTSSGAWSPGAAANVFGAMGIAHAADILEIDDDQGMPGGQRGGKGVLLLSADNVMNDQAEDGSFPAESEWTKLEPPILQGRFMSTANSLVAIERAAAHTGEARYKTAAERAVLWVASNEAVTTQDHIFKIIALMHFGTPDHKRVAWSEVEKLVAQQQPGGGWKESSGMDGANAFATGQVLYAFKQAGVSVQSPEFRRGVDFLLQSQVNGPVPDNGTWQPVHTASQRPSTIAPTMWAVIGLAGAYGTEPLGALQVTRRQSARPLARNLEIVLDVSGSMNTKLEGATRWKTALAVLDDVVASLPDDLGVGLRVYGHRESSKSAKTCLDSEQLVPIAKLDRDRILKAAAQLKPRGETPLVFSVLKAVDDLKAAGGGSVILITDGEESCRGDAKAAAAQIAASDVNVALNIVGFTLTGKAVEAELGTFAKSTGGAYYSAQDGGELARAVKLATFSRLPYDILDATGKVVASGETSELSRELGPGKYRFRIDALGETVEDSLTISADQTTRLGLGVENGKFVIQR